MNRRSRARRVFFLSCLILGAFACTPIKLQPLPPPSPTAKLRVFFLPVSDVLTGGRFWPVSQKEYAANMAAPLAGFLRSTGIYELVPQHDVDAVLGGRKDDDILWNSADWAMAKNVGRAVHADYIVVTRRGYSGFFFFEMLLINLETGRVIKSEGHPGTFFQGGAQQDEFRKSVRQAYREIFQQAKGELLATAIRKGRRLEAPETSHKPAASSQVQQSPPLPAVETPSSRPAEAAPTEAVSARPPKAATTPQIVTEKRPAPSADLVMRPHAPRSSGKELQAAAASMPEAGKTRLAVHDLETAQPLQVAGLILTEALREEIFKLGDFELVNREDLSRALEEMKLQQSGLVQDERALQLGRWLAARQSVTGRLGSLGNIVLLQIKRTDIETLETLAIASLKAQAGKEEELLNSLPEIARKLTQKP